MSTPISLAVQESREAAVREAAADRPAHLAYWEALKAWHAAGRPGSEPEAPRGVSWDVEVALSGDAERIWDGREGQDSIAYPALRRKWRATASRRQTTMAQGPSLSDLLP